MTEDLKRLLDEYLEEKGIEGRNEIVRYMSERLSLHVNPVSSVMWVPLEKVEANDYNPNTVAPRELQLLYISIRHDGYTQPIVTIHDKERDRYVIIDGFHRYHVCRTHRDIYERNRGMVPVVVLNKTLAERMASTVRHNRARGKHTVQGMSALVYKLLSEGWSDADICNELGMEPEELVRLKHITGFSKLFENVEYNRAWLIRRQVELQKKYGKR